MLSVADGSGDPHREPVLGAVPLRRGAAAHGRDIRTEGHHAVVRGVPKLSGAPVRATDIRAGVALVLAGLVAEGETVVGDAAPHRRGYEDLAGIAAARSAPRCRARELVVSSSSRRLGRPLPTEPAALLSWRARATGSRSPRLLSSSRAGGARRTGGGGARRTVADMPYTLGVDRRAGCGEVDVDRRAHHRGARGWPASSGPTAASVAEAVAQVGVLCVDPTSPLQRRGDPGRPRPHEHHALDPTRLHPLDGHTGPPGRPLARGARRRAAARRGGHRGRHRRDRRRRPDGGRDRRRPPTRPSSSSPRAGATRCRPARPGCSRSPTSSSSTRPTARAARGTAGPRPDARPGTARRVAPRDRRHDGDRSRGRRRSSGRRWRATGPTCCARDS